MVGIALRYLLEEAEAHFLALPALRTSLPFSSTVKLRISEAATLRKSGVNPGDPCIPALKLLIDTFGIYLIPFTLRHVRGRAFLTRHVMLLTAFFLRHVIIGYLLNNQLPVFRVELHRLTVQSVFVT